LPGEGTAPYSHGSERGQHMYRSYLSGLLAGIAGLVSVTPAVGQQVCKPALAITEVRFSGMQPPTMERKWTAVVLVDASRCAMNSAGYFEIGFSRQKETGVEIDFSEKFEWSPPSVNVAVNFWADEAVEQYWIGNVSACPCSR
jgi:hypothetical protein